ncbi:MAG: hypothetical protein AAGH70_07920 [Pseudomonadota bacterium]
MSIGLIISAVLLVQNNTTAFSAFGSAILAVSLIFITVTRELQARRAEERFRQNAFQLFDYNVRTLNFLNEHFAASIGSLEEEISALKRAIRDKKLDNFADPRSPKSQAYLALLKSDAFLEDVVRSQRAQKHDQFIADLDKENSEKWGVFLWSFEVLLILWGTLQWGYGTYLVQWWHGA